MDAFASGEEAGRWLSDKLDTLKESIEQAAELHRLVKEGAREVLTDIDADPTMFSRDANDRLRRYTVRISQATLRRLERDGFQVPVLDRSCRHLLGQNAALALEILRAMIDTLREHTEALSVEGTQLYGEGRQSFSEATREIGAVMDKALDHWSEEGPGRHRRSRLPWRRQRAQLIRPMDDAAFRQEARKAVQRHLPTLEGALKDTGEGSVRLSMAKYYGGIISHLTEHIAAGENLRERGPTISLQAEQRLSGIRRASSQDNVRHSADMLLMDNQTLDAILDRLDVSSAKFLQRVDMSSEELANLGSEELEQTIRGWVDAQLGGLASPSLTEALGGAAGGSKRARQRLLDFLAQGQPLMLFNDDLPLQFDNGMRGQCFVVAETNDPSLSREFREACHQMGFPDPHLEVIETEREGQLTLRVVQFVAGLPFFAQVDRLMAMIDAHRLILIEEDPAAISASAAPIHLRDLINSRELSSLLPSRIERAFRQERALLEDPKGAMSIDQAIAEAHVEPLPVEADP